MAKQTDEVSRLREELDRLKAMLGLAPSGGPESQINHMEHGSDEHAQFLGLVVVDDDDDPTGFTTYLSKQTGRLFRLEDELGAVAHYPGVDPDKAALMLLRGKVNVLESGPPEAPPNTPSLWQPVDQYTVLVGGRR